MKMRATRRVTRAVKFIAKAAGEAAVLLAAVWALLTLQAHAKTVRHHAVPHDLEVAVSVDNNGAPIPTGNSLGKRSITGILIS